MNKDFIWGSASAAYQIEGAADAYGKGQSIWDEYSKVPGNTFKDTTGEVAIDFYHKYEEDINLMAEMGLEAYRFSISWPRILPNGSGEVNQEGIDFYHKVIDLLLEKNIKPVLTIYHWDLPKALQDEYMGWEGRQIIEDFINYCEILFKEYGSKVYHWVTLNEQNIFTTLGYVYKVHPPKVCDYQRFVNANHIASVANAKAIKLFKDMKIDGIIGASLAYSPSYAKSPNPLDVLAMENAQELTAFFWGDVYGFGRYNAIQIKLLEQQGITIPFEEGDKEALLNGVGDFLGLNYYTSMTASHESEVIEQSGNTIQFAMEKDLLDNYFYRANNPHVELTDWNWIIDPQGLHVALRRLFSRYNMPILITENGLGAYDTLEEDGSIHDQYRIDYLEAHIKAIKAAQNDGCEVLGYCTWSMQDLFSWLNGYSKRYGFVYVDRDEDSEKELKRYKKDSFYWYKKVIEENGKNIIGGLND